MFIGWIKEGGDHERAFETSSFIQMGKNSLRGTWTVVRKIRVVRLIWKLIEEEIMVRGVRERYEEGCTILSEKETGIYGGGENEEEQKYMCELYLLRVRGEQKKLKEDEVTVLRREVEEERKKRETVEGEKRELEERIKRMREEMETMKKTGALSPPPLPVNTSTASPTALSVIRSLEGTTVTFSPDADGIKREFNSIIHHGDDSFRNCFIGGVMSRVSFPYFLLLFLIV